MSFRHVDAALRVPGLAVAEKLVLALIAQHADREGRGWPSDARIGALAGLSADRVRQHVAALVKRGFVRRGDDGKLGRGHRRVLVLALDGDEKGCSAPPLSAKKGCSAPSKGVEHSPKRGPAYKGLNHSNESVSGKAGNARQVLEAPNEEHRKIAREEGVDVHREFERFSYYIKANGKRYADEAAAFCGWLRNDKFRSQQPKPDPSPFVGPNVYADGP